MKRTGASISVISDYLFKTGGIPNFISAEALPDHRALIAYSDMGKSNNGTATILEVSGDRIAGGFTDESSQCIALQSGEAGQEIEVIFDGVAELPGAVAGREITSTGVYGYCPKDGWLWVRPEWDGIVTGRYRGTGTYGATNPTSLSLGFQPSLLIIFKAAVDSNYELVAVMSKMSPIGAVYTGSPTNSAGNILQVSLTDDGISWYSKEGELFQMSGQYDYNYLAIR